MNADLLASCAASLESALDDGGHPATYEPQGYGDPLAVHVAASEQPDQIEGRPWGHDLGRMIQATLSLSAFTAAGIEPGKGDTLTISTGPQAGAWNVLGINQRSAVHVTLAARSASRMDAAAQGAREVRR